MTDLSPFSPMADLVGTRIDDINGCAIGHVSELLVDSTSGRIAYVEIRLDNVQRLLDEQLVVPWSSIRIGHAGGVWQLPVGRSALMSLVRARQT